MSWNYRIVCYKDGSGYGLHEVYYDEDGVADGMTEKPISFSFDKSEEVIKAIEMALKDCKERPIFIEPESWSEK